MKRAFLTNVIAVLAIGVSTVATSFALFATSERFLVSSFNFVALEILPSEFVSTVIQEFGNDALWLSMVFTGFVLSVLLGAIGLGSYRLVGRVLSVYEREVGVAVATVLLFVVAAVVVGDIVSAIAPALVGGLAVLVVEDLPGITEEPLDAERRTTVQVLGGIAAFNILAHVVGFIRREQTQATEQALQAGAVRREAESLVNDANEKSLAAENLKPLISEIGVFYTVDINPEPPQLNANEWTLSVTGAVDEEASFDYNDIQGQEIVHEHKAIRCLSDDIDGDLLDNAVWTGCRVGDLLDDVELQGDYAMMYGADEYYYSIAVDELKDCTLAFGMNGFELPPEHGYPARLLVPNRWGKLHMKWLVEIEIIDAEDGGYWEDRGWDGMGEVNAVTKLDQINRLGGGTIQVVGHAYAGSRGVDTVEVSLDGGDSWEDAMLSEQLPDPDTLRQWVYEIQPDEHDESSFEFRARLVDGEGTTQTEEQSGPHPDGATGWIERSISAN